jgi:hypothetical protein
MYDNQYHPQILNYITQEEFDDVKQLAEAIGARFTISYYGHGTWMAKVLDAEAKVLAHKRIREKDGAPGNWHPVKQRGISQWV